MHSRFFIKASAIILFGFFATLSAQEEEEARAFISNPIAPSPSQTIRANLPEVEIQNLDMIMKDMIVQSMSAQVAAGAEVAQSAVATRVPTPNEVKSAQPFRKEFHELETGETPGAEFTPTPREPLQTTTEDEVIPS